MDDQAAERFAPHAVAAGGPDYVFAFHDNDEIGPRMQDRLSPLIPPRRPGIVPRL
jgi:hypothetical protein